MGRQIDVPVSPVGDIPINALLKAFKDDRDLYRPAVAPTARKARTCASLLSKCRFASLKIIDSCSFCILLNTLTVYVLIMNDLRLIVTSKAADDTFDYITSILFVVFVAEIILQTAGRKDYFPGFFFFLDVVTTITLFLDLTWVSDELASTGHASGHREHKVASLGLKLVRLVRVIRLLRVVRAYKSFMRWRRRTDQARSSEVAEMSDDEMDDESDDAENHRATRGDTAVGQRLTANMMQTTIFLLLALLMVLPILDLEESTLAYSSAQFGADEVQEAFVHAIESNGLREDYRDAMLRYMYYHNWFATHDCCRGDVPGMFKSHNFWVGLAGQNLTAVESTAPLATLSSDEVARWMQKLEDSDLAVEVGSMPDVVVEYLSQNWTVRCETYGYHHMGLSLLGEEIPGVIDTPVRCPDELRVVEVSSFSPLMISRNTFEDWAFVFYFDLRPYIKADALMSLIRTTFVCFVLMVSLFMFMHDAKKLVLEPLEQMATKMEQIASNLMDAKRITDEALRHHREHDATNGVASLFHRVGGFCSEMWNPRKQQKSWEMGVLEKTILKLGNLLAMSYGEAGARTVQQNLSKNHVMMTNIAKGVRVECIIGVVRVRDFGMINVMLQHETTTLVNHIAEIVHSIADVYYGFPNRNDGEAFLIVWNLSQRSACKMAHMSIMAFARMYGVVHRAHALAEYRMHPALQQLGPGFRVDLGFGLHTGWAIQGAVGSEFKISTSYMSPHVGLATTIERATLAYRVQLLVSQPLVELCKPGMLDVLRCIDNVIVSGYTGPMQLYSLDMDCADVEMDPPTSDRCRKLWKSKMYRMRQRRAFDKANNLKAAESMPNIFFEDRDLAAMCHTYTFKFKQSFNTGYCNYVEGEWDVAQDWLTRTRTMLGQDFIDGPSDTLLARMQAYDFVAPRSWRGVHNLVIDGMQQRVVSRQGSAFQRRSRRSSSLDNYGVSLACFMSQ